MVRHNLGIDEGLDQIIATNIEKLGLLSGFIHVAGISCTLPLKAVQQSNLHEVFSINTFCAFELAKLCTRRGVFQPKGMSNVFISSAYSIVGSAANSVYAASKAALNGACRSLAIEFAPRKIRFNCVAPGFVATEMLTSISSQFGDGYIEKIREMHPLGLGSPEDVSQLVLFLLSDNSKWITGAVIPVDGGFTVQ